MTRKIPFTGHLVELRTRILVSLAVAFAGFIVAFAFSENIFRVLTLPMRSDMLFRTTYPYLTLLPRQNASDLVFLAPAEAFWVHMKIAMISGFIASFPVIVHQIWKFISPGLHDSEKRFAFPFISITSGLFFMGAAFCFVVVLPFAMKFLLTYKTESLTPMISVGRYIDFCLKFIVAFGVVFELPIVLVFLTRMGVVSPRALARNRKYAVLAAFVAAAVLTPTPDAFNQVLMAVPIIILYEIGITASKIFTRRPHAVNKREESQNDSV
jgi:sec-independent protein translocase protein TatC